MEEQEIQKLADDYNVSVSDVRHLYNKAEREGLDVRTLLKEHNAESNRFYRKTVRTFTYRSKSESALVWLKGSDS